MRAIISPDDLKRGELVDPGWYPCEIVEYKEEEAKTDGSTNCIYYFKVTDHPKYKGAIFKRLFNEKAMGFGKNLWAALDFPYDAEAGYIIETPQLAAQVGKKVNVYVKRGQSNKGNDFNDVSDFRKLA